MRSRLNLPVYIAFCGIPKSGKSLVQEILLQNYGVQPVDDGAILREIAIKHFGASQAQVETQEGKATLAHWPNGDAMIDVATGQHMTWRQVLGQLGNRLESLFGKYVMPMTACARLGNQPGPFSFGSVRRDQGRYYQQHGGIIVEIVNPQAQPTGNEFDTYDASICDYRIMNDGLARGLAPAVARVDLERKLHELMLEIHFKALKAA
ncbi:hypothetical protein IVB12_15900 [Bradyrhizobium sp. 179]|uniref:hypothetical protein n=1 Tax=Bradyrhizobium sp. 179 TaxID=2782648 RepID=UPI001FF97B7F|nr:hypothetical protein [Bradyrhizobium sp. 179]MCK1543400.1 hypothetical protein [Bradyrhizobium sp. 179]